ncbi:MAG: hypothetical protein N3A55_06120 [Methylohalobius sp.]|nr:hypothetical protein [Methylohalobius sp.]
MNPACLPRFPADRAGAGTAPLANVIAYDDTRKLRLVPKPMDDLAVGPVVQTLVQPGTVVDCLADAGQVADGDLLDPAPQTLADKVRSDHVQQVFDLPALFAGDLSVPSGHAGVLR